VIVLLVGLVEPELAATVWALVTHAALVVLQIPMMIPSPIGEAGSVQTAADGCAVTSMFPPVWPEIVARVGVPT